MLNSISAQVDDVIFEKLTNDKKIMNTNSLSEVVRNKLIYAYERESSEQEIKNLKQELESLKTTVSKILGASIHNLITQYKFIRMNDGDEKMREIKKFADQKLEELKRPESSPLRTDAMENISFAHTQLLKNGYQSF